MFIAILLVAMILIKYSFLIKIKYLCNNLRKSVAKNDVLNKFDIEIIQKCAFYAEVHEPKNGFP